MRIIVLIILVGSSVISAWVVGLQMRRKIRKDLGRKATEADLSSIETWMKVDEVEERKEQTKPLG
jgi:hypothetical protein